MFKNYLLEVSRTKSRVMGISIKIFQFFMMERRLESGLSGRFKIKEFGDLSLVVQVDDDNRKLFEEFEEKLRSLAFDKKDSLKLIKGDNFYLKIYTKPNRKINAKFWKLVERDGKEYRKPLEPHHILTI